LLSLDEIKIINGIREKDPKALDKLINNIGKLVYYIANTILKEEQEKNFIDECYNDVFTTIWFNIDCFDEEYGNFKGWIVSITKYKALDIKRKLYKDYKNIEYIDELTKDENKELEKIETDEIINKLFDVLEGKDRSIFIKRYLEGYSIKEIAEKLGFSENYIHTRISRSRKKIKKLKEGMI